MENTKVVESEKIANIYLDGSVATNRSPEVQHEYETAVADLLASNVFSLCTDEVYKIGPYDLHLSIVENRLVMNVSKSGSKGGKNEKKVIVPMSPFRRLIKDYFMICESYYKAVKESTTRVQLETIDMARRGLHNDGADLLIERLLPQVEIDFNTARRLFTLICVLHIK